ncbi:MAG: hypothetical protein U0939_18970 [Pirellulales bacterium]
MPKANIDDSVSLFPFLSILAAVIGILVLMITAITLGQVGQDSPEATASAEEAAAAAQAAKERAAKFKSLRDQTKADAAVVADLTRRLQDAGEQNYDAQVQAQTLAQLQQEINDLQAARDKAIEANQQRAQQLSTAQTQLQALTAELKQLDDRLKPLLEQLEQLRKQVAERKSPPPEAQVQVRPSGTGGKLRPYFVECAGASIVLHDRSEPLRIPTAQAGSHPEFLALLDRVQSTPDSTVVFLIRPDGVGTYRTAKAVARGRSVTNGKLAIGSQGKLDLTLFRQSLEN